MDILKEGKGNHPKPKENQYVIGDMWGYWTLYEDYYNVFPEHIKEYIEHRKYECNYFNQNYISLYIKGKN